LLWKIDLGKTVDTLRATRFEWFALAIAIMIATVLPMAMRWQWLLRAQRMDERLGWLTRAYLVSYTAGQILPTAIGGDAVRIFETSRKHPGRTADITAIVLLERGLGGAATVLPGAFGLVLAIWAAARAVGIELGPRIYYVMGPLFFLVLLVPFTLNGFAVREAFFVSFLGSVGIAADPAFAAGFLFFLITVALATPGGAV